MTQPTNPTTTAPFCEWYLLCDHQAIGLVKHPILGDVPVCHRCATKHTMTVHRAPWSPKLPATVIPFAAPKD